MKKITNILSLFIILGIIGCGPGKFKIISLQSEFDDINTPASYRGINNRLTNMSTQGGTHIDDKGIYLNPFVKKNKLTGKIEQVGFVFNHYTDKPSTGFSPIIKIIFLTNIKERIVVCFENLDSDFKIGSWNPYLKNYITSYSESAIGEISKIDYVKLCDAYSLRVKLIGKKNTLIVKQNKIAKKFISNLNDFANLHIR